VTSWVEGAAGSAYDVDNLPYGVFSVEGEAPRVGVRIGDFVLDAGAVAAYGRAEVGIGAGPDLTALWQQPSMNAFLAAGRGVWDVARAWLVEVLANDAHAERASNHLRPLG